MMKVRFTINSFQEKYPNEDACLHEIFLSRYGSLKACSSCKKTTNFYRIASKKVYSCQYCGHQISPLAGTIFHKSDTDLKKWFYAIYLFSVSKNGVSAKELERHLGVTYKTAWRIGKQIRELFSQNKEALSNLIEVDETYYGGKHKGKRGRGSENKTPVIGMVERKGEVKATVAVNTKQSTVIPLVKANVKLGSHVMTDEYLSYRNVAKHGYSHSKVNHGRKEYVKGDCHTNTIEGFWSQMKRSIDGTYHAVSPKFLQTYVNEFVYRYNHRTVAVPLFDLLLGQVVKLTR